MKKKVKVTRDGSDVVMTLYLLLFSFILLYSLLFFYPQNKR